MTASDIILFERREDFPGPLSRWLDHVVAHDPAGLPELLDEDVTFHSPVVHTPQQGKAITVAYLSSAGNVLGNDSFRYTRAIVDSTGKSAMLEFALELDEIHVNGVDIIEWNDAGLIQDFKVLVRPLKAVNKVWEEMGKMLEKMRG